MIYKEINLPSDAMELVCDGPTQHELEIPCHKECI